MIEVDKLVFPADFYVIDMNHDKNAAPMLLERPFIMTAKTKIDVSTGSLTLEFEGEIVKFNIFNCVKRSSDGNTMNFVEASEPRVESVCSIDIVNPLSCEVKLVEPKELMNPSSDYDDFPEYEFSHVHLGIIVRMRVIHLFLL